MIGMREADLMLRYTWVTSNDAENIHIRVLRQCKGKLISMEVAIVNRGAM